MSDNPGRPTSRTRDHIIPKSKGGLGFTVTVCAKCNNEKADYLPSEWAQRLIDNNDDRLKHFVKFCASTQNHRKFKKILRLDTQLTKYTRNQTNETIF